mmetsp:Transcript_5810/g.10146  ORF Transcript_5810/g.10146 Transcript_5810/m.10146 type:complete len:183 (-) Transcript_5810:65-613(-)
MLFYSGGLIVLGSSYKMLLYEYLYLKNATTTSHRMLFEFVPRWLAGGDGALQFETSDRRQRIANFFCFSMALVWFCSDTKILIHRGIRANLNRSMSKVTGRVRIEGLGLALLRLALVAFIATLSLYETNPAVLAVSGLAGITAEIALRIVTMVVLGFNELPNEGSLQIEEEEKTREPLQRTD